MPKVKLFAAIPRRPDISPQEFHDHWRHPHGTMGRTISILRKYVQGHQIACDLLGDDQTRYEGIAEAWMDNIADAEYFAVEPTYVKRVIPDEPLFIDLANLKFLIAEEEVLVAAPRGALGEPVGNLDWFDDDRAINIKIVQLIEAEGDTPWRSDEDADLGQRIGAFRHVCSTPARAIHGDAPPFLGVRELWWPTVWAFREGVAADRAAFDTLIGRPGKAFTALVQAERFK